MEIVYSYAQASTTLIHALAREGVDGIIFAAAAGSLLLMLALTKTRDRKEIARMFSEY